MRFYIHLLRYAICLSLLLLHFSLSFANETTHEKKRRLLIINSYNESAPWSQEVTTPILLQTAPLANITADVVHMNETFIRNDSLYKEMENGIFRRFQHQKPDFLVLLGNMAFTLRDRIVREWGDIPIVLVGTEDTYAPQSYYLTGRPIDIPDSISKPLADLRQAYNFTFIETPCNYKETIDMMVRMLPGMKKLLFAADELYQNQKLDRQIQSYIAARYPHLLYERLVGHEGNQNNLQIHLLNDDPEVGILFSTWFYERKNLLGFPSIISGDFQLVASSRQPVFALRNAYVYKEGFTGGYFYDRMEIQQSVASALELLFKGTEARDIPFAYSKQSHPFVNYAQLLIDGIDTSLCPEDTIFINKPLTFWQEYRWWIICGIVLLLSLAVIMLVKYQYQRNRIKLLSAHDTLIRNMPILYVQAKAIFDQEGKITGMKYRCGNKLFNSLFAQAENDPQKNAFAQIEYMSKFTEMVFKEKRAVTFTHYFKQINKYYEFILCTASEEQTLDIFAIDITARKDAEHTLRQTNQKLEMTLGIARIIPWRWNLKEGLIYCEANKILSHLNFTKEKESTPKMDIIKAPVYFKKIHPEDQERIYHVYESLISGKTQQVKEEYRVVSEIEGRKITDWLEINAAVERRDANDCPVSLVGSLLLITERKRQEMALISAREKAQESERLKSAFLANMSHEIRTPLNAIVGFSSLLTATEDESERQEFVNIIETNNQLLLQLISDILDLSKIEANTMEFNYQYVDLNQLAKEVEKTVESKVKPGVSLRFVPGLPVCYAQTEQNRLSQVLINLLVNATKFTEKGEIVFGYEVRENELYFYVKDTGVGISQENQKKIFERFTKLNSFVQGTGLGLSICKNIISRMKGRIGVESEGEGKGCTFWFTIPYKPEILQEEKQQTGTGTLLKKPNGNKPVILIAEDNESNYMLFESILKKDYELIHAWNGEEAVEFYSLYHPHVIIMDINMPEMDGYEATREIRKISKTVPIIAITAYSFASDKERIMQNGFNGYMSKPIDIQKLREKLEHTINGRFMMM
ncbi:response regulator [Bacteroides sp.]|uniref:response regulator n=1 Tax=Bacteroides sp. TaxID=29523 RepID=UPI0023D24366|nr:response regulator [Bacteroides sp.]MDE6216104.1 response regulator [Bacteroides sp.]